MGLDGKEKILFYGVTDEKYSWMSNFSLSLQIVDEEEYPTNEHYYQSQKAKSPEMRKWIASAPTPYAAMKAGRSLRPEDMVKNWDEIKFKVMLKGLRCKFSQNKELKRKLICTGKADIHENSPTDMIWGVRGKDMLGKLLMQVRTEMKRC